MNALLVVVATLAVAAFGVASFLVGRMLGRGPSSAHFGGIGRIREIGEPAGSQRRRRAHAV